MRYLALVALLAFLVVPFAVGCQKETPKPTAKPGEKAGKAEPGKTEAPKTEAPKTEAPKTEAPKTEEPKTEAPKTEEPAPAPAPAETPK